MALPDPSLQLLTFGSRTYRVIIPSDIIGLTPSLSQAEEVEEAVEEGRGVEEGVDMAGIDKDRDTGVYTLAMTVHPELLKFVLGTKGRLRHDIERRTQTIIEVAKLQKVPKDNIKIKSKLPKSVRMAHRRITTILDQSLQKLPFTHFVSIPLTASPDISAAIDALRDSIWDNHAWCKGMDRSLFIGSSRIHLTLSMLRIYSPEAMDNAKAAISQAYEQFRRTEGGFTGSDAAVLSGLDVMGDDPENSHVLYIDLQANATRTKLEKLATLLQQALLEKKLITSGDVKPVKLHATLMNTKYRKAKDTIRLKKVNPTLLKAEPFDARYILDDYGRINLGSHPLVQMELSNRSVFGEEGYWSSDFTLNFA